MKKILLSLMVIAMASASVVGATRAVFTDTEQVLGNSFAAGALDLKVDNQDDPNIVHVVKENMVPQPGYTYQGNNRQWILKNAGTIAGVVKIKIKNVQNFENACLEPETDFGDATCDVGSNQGELGTYTWIKWSENHYGIYSPALGWSGSPMFNPLNSASDVVITGPTLAPGQLFSAYMWLDFPKRADNMENQAQGDSLSFDIEFSLEQV